MPTNPIALIGLNGAGKTNILSALTILSETLNNSYRYFYYDLEASLPDEEQSTIELHFEDEKGKKLGLKFDLYFDLTKAKNPLSHFKVKYRYLGIKNSRWTTLDNELFRRFHLRHRRGLSFEYIIKISRDDFRPLMGMVFEYIAGIEYYSATQFSDPSKCPVSLDLRAGKLSNNYEKAKDHERFLYDMFISFQDDKTAKERYMSIVGDSGLSLIENVEYQEIEIPSSNVRVLAGGRIKTISTKRTIIVPIFTVDGLPLSPSQLSEGTFKTLALAYYIINSNARLLLIEEPEVGVHHGLLSSIVELIKFKSQNQQVIISTHSDVVIDHLNPENILLVKKTSGSTAIHSIAKYMSKNDYEALKLYLKNNGNLGEFWRESGFNND